MPVAPTSGNCHNGVVPNEDMVTFWNEEGGRQWVRERDRYDVMLAPCGRRVLDVASPVPGERVLDVGCGNGATTLDVARRVGPGGRVVGIDLSGPMLEVARRRIADEGLDVEFLQADAQTANFSEPFASVISRFGVMFFDNPAAAFANLAEALGPGGRVVFACWQDMMSNEWMRVPAMTAVEYVGVPDVPPPGAPSPFSLADPSVVQELLTGAGFTDIRIDAASDALTLGRDPDEVMAFFETDTLGRRLFADKDPAAVSQALEAIRVALQPYASTDGVVLGSAYWVASAVKDEQKARGLER